MPTATSLQAATATANGNAACVGGGSADNPGKDIRPYYWEIGNGTAVLASGSVGTRASGAAIRSTTVMPIASASKWLYSTYWVQRQHAALTPVDIDFLNFHSGYTHFTGCDRDSTVGSCLDQPGSSAGSTNGTLDPATVGSFAYGGGHMQVHAATVAGIGALDNAGLAVEMRSQIGSEIQFSYTQPQLAGGAQASAAEYAKMLRKIVGGQLAMKDKLGTHPVCVDPATCALAVRTPSPPGEQWHYAIGHWVEDDPAVGDGSFSSPGAFGFYPWIDSSKHYYGIVARFRLTGALTSVYCGRLIRKAWMTGVT